MYIVDRECGDAEYKIYKIDRLEAKRLFNKEPVGTDPKLARKYSVNPFSFFVLLKKV